MDTVLPRKEASAQQTSSLRGSMIEFAPESIFFPVLGNLFSIINIYRL